MTAVDLGESTRLERLRTQIRQLEDARTVETQALLPALRPLIPHAGLRTGATYAVQGSAALAMALLSGASASGAWCAVIGVPEFGAEAAAEHGIALDRTVLVPDPAEHWIATTAALIDVLNIVVLRPPSRTTDGDAARLQARLRRHDATLVVLGDWPRCEARLSVTRSRWLGVGDGHGHLRARQVVVRSQPRSGRVRDLRLWLPDTERRIRAVDTAELSAPTIQQVAS